MADPDNHGGVPLKPMPTEPVANKTMPTAVRELNEKLSKLVGEQELDKKVLVIAWTLTDKIIEEEAQVGFVGLVRGTTYVWLHAVAAWDKFIKDRFFPSPAETASRLRSVPPPNFLKNIKK